MPKFSNVQEILDFAINEEKNAAAFYEQLAAKTGQPWMKNVFLDFAAEERGHQAKLQAVRDGRQVLITPEKIADLRITEYLSDVEPAADLTFSQALIVAMKKEKQAFRLYTELAKQTDEPQLRHLLLALAQEEAKHKLRFEIEYDDLLE